MIRNVKIVGLDELQRKCKFDVLVQPEMDDARDTIVARLERGGKGLGVQRNVLSTDKQPLGATVTSTLNYPRTRGTAWGRKNEAIAKSMGPNVIKKAIGKIETRWAQ